MSPDLQRTGRRTVLKSLAAASTLLSSGIAAGDGDGSSVSLGDFESGLNGWTTDGGVELSRVSSREYGGVVEHGDYALRVDPRGDAAPMITNQRRTQAVDLVKRPYLLANVVAEPASDEFRDLKFRFRLWHSRAGGHSEDSSKGGGNSGGSRGSRGNGGGGSGSNAPVETSDPLSVTPLLTETLYWDLSQFSETARRNATRLEVFWHRSGEQPTNGPRGRDRGTAPGSVFLDRVRVVENPTRLSSNALDAHGRKLRLRHGPVTDLVLEETSADSESGHFVFSDGATVDVRVKRVGQGQFELTLGETTYKLGGGWE